MQVVALAFARAQLAEDVLHHHQRAVDENSEVDGADGKQVGRDSSRMQKDEREQQRQRNGERDDDRGANAHQKRHQHDKDQSHAQQHVVLDRVDGQLHQIAAVVVGTHLYVRRQDVFVQLLGLRFDALQHILRLLAAPHHDDAFDGVIRLVEAEFAQARSVPDGHVADIADAHRHSVLRAHDDVADVRGIANQAEAANVVELAALRIESAAGVGVVDRELLHHGRHGDVVGVESCRIEQHLILHHGAAETGVVRNARHLLVFALDHPVFVGLQFLRRAVGALDHVAIDQARGTRERRQRGRHARADTSLRSAAETPPARAK